MQNGYLKSSLSDQDVCGVDREPHSVHVVAT